MRTGTNPGEAISEPGQLPTNAFRAGFSAALGVSWDHTALTETTEMGDPASLSAPQIPELPVTARAAPRSPLGAAAPLGRRVPGAPAHGPDPQRPRPVTGAPPGPVVRTSERRSAAGARPAPPSRRPPVPETLARALPRPRLRVGESPEAGGRQQAERNAARPTPSQRARPLTPGERRQPHGALPRMSVPAGSAPRAQGPRHRAGASPLARSLAQQPRSSSNSHSPPALGRRRRGRRRLYI
jgi:hypothetical protein